MTADDDVVDVLAILVGHACHSRENDILTIGVHRRVVVGKIPHVEPPVCILVKEIRAMWNLSACHAFLGCARFCVPLHFLHSNYRIHLLRLWVNHHFLSHGQSQVTHLRDGCVIGVNRIRHVAEISLRPNSLHDCEKEDNNQRQILFHNDLFLCTTYKDTCYL